MRAFQNIQHLIYSFDIFLTGFLSKLCAEKPALIVLYFHKIFRDKEELNKFDVDIQQATTINDFENCIKYFLDCNYTFLSPDELISPIDPNGKYILLTFDDGYANNELILPILEKYKVPALFFIAVNHVLQNKAYWWDIIFHLKSRGINVSQINQIKAYCKTKSPSEIDRYFTDVLKITDLSPLHESERPFKPDELKNFAANPLVFIGNHTMDHAILTACSETEALFQINNAQEELKKIINYYPKFISYPNGNFSERIIDVAQKCGLEAGFSCIRGKNYTPKIRTYKGNFEIKRFIIPKLGSKYKFQLRVFRAPFSLYNSLINMFS